VKLTQKLLICLVLAALPALCGPINSTGQWTVFGWNGSATALGIGASGYTGSLGTAILGSTTAGDSFADPFTVSGPGVFTIQDIKEDGDRFFVFLDGSVALMTNATNDGTTCGNDPLGCAGNSKFSSGSLNITGAGAHTISISVFAEASSEANGLGSTALFKFLAAGTAPPTGGGGGAATAMPEPTTFSLMGLGLGGLLYGWRARCKT
jgi:hypothetical protein